MHKITISAIVALWLGGVLLVGAAQAQDERFRQRQVLDPNSDEWLDEEPVTSDDPLEQARELLGRGEAREARDLLKDWVGGNVDDDRYYEGVFLLGEAYFEKKDYWAAAEQYEIVADNAGGELFYSAIRRSIDVAVAFLSGEKRRVWKVLYLPAADDGIELLDRTWARVPGTRIGERVLKIKADYFFEKGEMDFAQQEYALLAQAYPNGRYARLAMLRSAEAAEASFHALPYDDQPLIEADERYRQMADAFPVYAERESVDERRAGIRETRAAKDLEIARWYERARHPAAAAYYYQLVVKDWPDTPAAREAAHRLDELGYQTPPTDEEPES
ncbi:MAG: outer membrane protein assembly factor BamD [Phycisphaerae bacterium]|nr:outer membrane protein assembly factor BamD [Phycisphaerae bacterium]